ncbi:MAG: aldo/keto reductase [Anaerolineae bacterium]
MQLDVIDLYQIHWPYPTELLEEGWVALERLRQEGKVRAIGVSNYASPKCSVFRRSRADQHASAALLDHCARRSSEFCHSASATTSACWFTRPAVRLAHRGDDQRGACRICPIPTGAEQR